MQTQRKGLPMIEKLNPEQAKAMLDGLYRRFTYCESGLQYDQRNREWLRSRDEKGRVRLRRLAKIKEALGKLSLTAEDKRFLNAVLGMQMVAKIEATAHVHPSEAAAHLATEVAALPPIK